jgi:hypothetical protein
MNPLSLGRLRLFLTVVMLLIPCSFVPQRTDAQSSPPAHKAPPPPPPPPATQQQFVSSWTSETGWTSELQLRNNAANQDLTVTPVLRLADGAETSLAPVTIKSQEVKSVDIAAAIAAASAPQLIGTYGSVALRYLSTSSGTLYANRSGHRPGLAGGCDVAVGGGEGDLHSYKLPGGVGTLVTRKGDCHHIQNGTRAVFMGTEGGGP